MTRPAGSWKLFLAELRRRKVFRVAAVYGTAAFVALQVADLVFPRLGLPEWTVTLVVAIGLAGLPIALGLAWALEATPDGVRRTESATAQELAAIAALPRARRWPAAAAALAGLALLAGGAWWTLRPAGPRTAVYDSIAVLPFANLSGDPSDDYFGEGLAEEVLNALAGIQGLKVAARTSSFAFKGARVDIRAIGDTLDVATVLEGSVRRSEGRIRITAQLVDASTGYHLWSRTYDQPLSELFSVQDAITAEIVGALRPQLSPAATEDLFRGGTDNVRAYDLYLQGRQKWATRDTELLRQAVLHFEEAVALDSSFALAWSGLADALDALAWRAPDALVRIPEARRAAQIALSLEPRLAEGWASLGVLATDFDRDWGLAELALRRAVQLKPSYAEAHHWLGDVYRLSGRPAQSLESNRIAMQLNPLSRTYVWACARALAETGRFAEALPLYMQLREEGWESGLPGATAAIELVLYARMFGFGADEAAEYAREWAAAAGVSNAAEAEVVGRAVVDTTLRRDARRALERMAASGYVLARILAAIGELDEALETIEQETAGNPQVVEALVDPMFAAVRDDERLQRLRASFGR